MKFTKFIFILVIVCLTGAAIGVIATSIYLAKWKGFTPPATDSIDFVPGGRIPGMIR